MKTLLNNNHREAKEENGIRKPKSILHAMTTDPSYFEPKMRLLQTITGLDFLEEEFTSEENRIERNDSVVGYKIFDSLDTVTNRFEKGKSLSCFCINNRRDEVYIAFKVPKQPFEDITYVTVKVKYEEKEEAGVHFRRFEIQQGTNKIKRGSPSITDFAIMLPFWYKNHFNRQYTLIYSDWDVMRNDLDVGKGPTPVSQSLFADII